MLTEDEAKEKMCPYQVDCIEYSQPPEKPAAAFVRRKCNASECMAWRWIEKPGAIVWGESDSHPGKDEIGRSKGLGYCGLAGKP